VFTSGCQTAGCGDKNISDDKKLLKNFPFGQQFRIKPADKVTLANSLAL
jgi:hypothetical protein